MIVVNACVIKILIAHVLFSSFAACEGNWRPVYRATKFTFSKIVRPPNATIISETFLADTRRKCVLDCSDRRSLSLYYTKSTHTCNCNQGLDSNTGSVPGATEIFYGEVESLQDDFEDGTQRKSYQWPHKRDCLQLYQNGAREDGIYTIQPVGGAPVDTWCDMTNGGWTVFQRRQDGSENFFRNWTDYVTGFGDKCGEYWLGLDNIHLLTKEPSELNISLVAFGDVLPASAYASYSTFSIGNSGTKYNLSVGGFDGNCGDSFEIHCGNQFSTYDNDNDQMASGCANTYLGAWWFSACFRSHLNGEYLANQTLTYASGVIWSSCWGYNYSLKETIMKVRRL